MPVASDTPVKEAVRNALEEAGRPLSPKEMAGYGQAKYNSLRSAANRMAKDGELEKLRTGVYDLPSRQADASHESASRDGDGAREPQAARYDAGTLASTGEAEAGARDAIYDVTASMGDGSFEIGEEVVGHISGDDALSRPGREVFWIFVRGDSMGDTFAKHTMVPVVRFDRPLDELQGDDVYFFRLEGAVQIKRLQRLPGDRIAVISDNDKYARYEIPLNDGIDFEILGRVLA